MDPTPPPIFLAPHWPRRWAASERLLEAVTPHLLAALNPRPGERILDVGTGTGAIAIAAARRGAAVTAIDISAPMVAFARDRAAGLGVEGIAFLRADAASEAIPGSPFDAATSEFGIMFFPVPVAAFANIRRQLRPGARFVFACWAPAADNPLHPNVLTAPFEPEPPWPLEGDAPGPFSLADPRRTRRLLAAAGFEAISRRRIDARVTLPARAIFDEAMLAGSGLTPGEQARATATIREMLGDYAAPGGLRVPLAFQLYRASVPAGGM